MLLIVCFTRAYSKRVPHTNCVRPWAAAVSVAAIGGCCRDNVEGVGEEEEASSVYVYEFPLYQ